MHVSLLLLLRCFSCHMWSACISGCLDHIHLLSHAFSHITPLKSILSPTLFIPCLLVRFIYIAFCSCSSHVFNSLSCLVLAVSIVVAVCVYVCVLFLLSFLFFIAMLQLVLCSPLLQCGCVLCVMRGGTRDGGPTVSHSCLTRKLSFSSFLSSSIIQLLCPIGAAGVCVCVCGVFLFLCLSVSLLLISLLLARFSSPSAGDHIPCMSTVIACLACNHGGRAL